MGRKMTRLKEILSVALQRALYRREVRYVQALRVKRVSDVLMSEALWDMSELDSSDVHGTYPVSSLQHAAVVVGGVIRAAATSVAAVVRGRVVLPCFSSLCALHLSELYVHTHFVSSHRIPQINGSQLNNSWSCDLFSWEASESLHASTAIAIEVSTRCCRTAKRTDVNTDSTDLYKHSTPSSNNIMSLQARLGALSDLLVRTKRTSDAISRRAQTWLHLGAA
eukprot:1443-Heterococcus_DN1.PRE.2